MTRPKFVVEPQSQNLRWLVRVLTVWLILMAVETLNGTFREYLLVSSLGKELARQVSLTIALTSIFAISVATVRWIGTRSRPHLLAVGLIWSLLTLGFELTLIAATSSDWKSDISRDYDVRVGGYMVFGLAFMLFAPWIASVLRASFARAGQ